MFFRVAAWHLPVIVLFVGLASAQEPKLVPRDEASLHQVKRVSPVYPQMAVVARIQGYIRLRIVIDQNGKVSRMRALSGHPILLQAALEAVKKWEYEPFKEGDTPVSVKTFIGIDFLPGAEQSEKYWQTELSCTQQIFHQSSKAEESCKAGLDAAVKLPKKFLVEKIDAYQNAGFAAKLAQKKDEAAEDFKQQLLFARLALDADKERAVSLHNDLAHAYKNVGDLKQADAEYTEAEKAAESELTDFKNRMKPPPHNELETVYTDNIQIITQEHAALLREMGRNADAEALEKKMNASHPVNP